MFRTNINTEIMKDKQIMPGNYTLVLHGAGHSEDYETIALLDYEGDDVIFEPYSPEYDYTRKEHVGDDIAIEEAMKFISRYPPFSRSRLSRITDIQGRVLGYELRPLYSSIVTFGHSDVLDVHYMQKDKKLVVYIRLKWSLRKAMDRDGRDTRFR